MLAKAVFEQIEDMLDVKGLKDSSVKTVIQALKVSSYCLMLKIFYLTHFMYVCRF